MNTFSPVLKRIDKVEATLQKIFDKIENRNDIDETTVKSDLIDIKNKIFSNLCYDDQENLFKVPPAPIINILSNDNNDSILPVNDTTTIFSNVMPTRRSVRLSAMKEANMSSIIDNSINPQQTVDEITKTRKKSKTTQITKNNLIASYFNASINKDNNSNKKVTKTQHKTAILDIINNGNNKELQLLPQIGLKTAFQIVMHR